MLKFLDGQAFYYRKEGQKIANCFVLNSFKKTTTYLKDQYNNATNFQRIGQKSELGKFFGRFSEDLKARKIAFENTYKVDRKLNGKNVQLCEI